MATPFVHLHNHSEFSLLDGATKIKDMVKYATQMEMPAIALTDHGVMYGAFEFYKEAKKAGIKGLIGCELYVATRGRKDRDPKKDGNRHLVAIAKNNTGYQNLMKLTTAASLEGFYYKPRVDKELLAELSEGLIICSACLGGELAQAVMKQGYEEAKNVAAWFREVFKDDFYLEVQGHHTEGQWEVNETIKRISREMGIKMVATNDSHYLKAEDASAHDVLICIQTGTTVNDPNRMRYEPREFYLKSYEEMMGEFEKFAPDAIENTLEIAEKVNVDIEEGRAPMPQMGLDEGKNAQETMMRLCGEGLEKRIKNVSEVHRERLAYEMDIIEKTGFAQYFLIVMDISNHARGKGIYFGVRGSAAGSLASYCLGITDLDPIEYDLTFERFLNPERITMPDIDMDFEDTRRQEVIDHVTQQYGQENVAYITTFGTLGAKAALRDAGRALAMPLPEVDRIAKMVPALPLGLSIERAMHGWKEKDYSGNPEMVGVYENDTLARNLIDTAKRIEGITRNESVHAAGIMISDRPLVEYTPLRKLNDGSMATQYPHSSLEAIGLLKMDFLGLVNLTILSRAVKLIEETQGVKVDVWDIPLDYSHPDAKKAYDMLGRGETTGVFQLESAGMRKYVVDLKPNSVKELSAMVALYRPGPLAHIPRFIRSKFDPDSIKYQHKLLEPILKDTYGVIVYQDQVLKIVQAVGGLSLGQADLLRRAMGKKQIDYMLKQKANFLAGAKERGVSEKIASDIFADIEPFAGYAFNGAHAACYAMVAYQTAYLKANYPSEYLAASMGAYIDKTDKVVNILEECGRMNVEILLPCVNNSYADFTVPAPNTIRFGLGAIKNVGRTPIDAILSARDNGGPFKDLEDFCVRVFQAQNPSLRC
jgi:DNA polymerase III subunit alpha